MVLRSRRAISSVGACLLPKSPQGCTKLSRRLKALTRPAYQKMHTCRLQAATTWILRTAAQCLMRMRIDGTQHAPSSSPRFPRSPVVSCCSHNSEYIVMVWLFPMRTDPCTIALTQLPYIQFMKCYVYPFPLGRKSVPAVRSGALRGCHNKGGGIVPRVGTGYACVVRSLPDFIYTNGSLRSNHAVAKPKQNIRSQTLRRLFQSRLSRASAVRCLSDDVTTVRLSRCLRPCTIALML